MSKSPIHVDEDWKTVAKADKTKLGGMTEEVAKRLAEHKEFAKAALGRMSPVARHFFSQAEGLAIQMMIHNQPLGRVITDCTLALLAEMARPKIEAEPCGAKGSLSNAAMTEGMARLQRAHDGS